MASVSTDKNGNRRILFVAKDGSRKTIRLGKLPKRDAEAVKVKVERLVSATITGHAIDDETSRWLVGLEQPLHDKLSAVGLVAKRESAKLGSFLSAWIEGRKSNYKPASVIVWKQVAKDLKAFLNETCPLMNVTPDRAEAFRQSLVTKGLRATTIHKRLQIARMFFSHAKRQGLIVANPFEFVNHRPGDASERRAYVPVEDVLRVIEHAPNVTWKVLIALSRFAGLRTPSESLSLRWQDIDWASNRIVVTSPKTAHLSGKGYRVIPLFPALKPFLEVAWDEAPEGAVYVVPDEYRRRAQGPRGWANANLRTTLEKVICRAKVESWPRLWHSMRASCESDLARQFPLPTVTRWLGNTVAVAMKHYVSILDGDFDRAANEAIPELVEAAQKAAQQVRPAIRKSPQSMQAAHEKTLELQGIASSCDTLQAREAEGKGLEPSTPCGATDFESVSSPFGYPPEDASI